MGRSTMLLVLVLGLMTRVGAWQGCPCGCHHCGRDGPPPQLVAPAVQPNSKPQEGDQQGGNPNLTVWSVMGELIAPFSRCMYLYISCICSTGLCYCYFGNILLFYSNQYIIYRYWYVISVYNKITVPNLSPDNVQVLIMIQ